MPELMLVPIERTSPDGASPAALRLSEFPCLVGRGPDCDLSLNDPMVSRHHCRLDWQDGRPIVEDLASRNGTRINGEMINRRSQLSEGDLLQLAHTVFAVRLHSELPAGMPRRVLVVEDDAEVAETLVALLRGWGHVVEVAPDGEGAVEAAYTCRPDAVVLDLHPGNEARGLEVAHRLRHEAGLREARVLALSRRPPQAGGAVRPSRDVDGVLTKPLDAPALRRALAAVD
jgi:CheY-like chemotaxis protein